MAAYTIEEMITNARGVTADELRERQCEIELFGGGVEVVDPNSPITAEEFAEAAFMTFEENGAIADEVAAIDEAMSEAAAQDPSINNFVVGVVVAWYSMGDSYRSRLSAATEGYIVSPEGVPYRLIDVRGKVRRYHDYEQGWLGSICHMLGISDVSDDERPEDIDEANFEIQRIFAELIFESLADIYEFDRGFAVKRMPSVLTPDRIEPFPYEIGYDPSAPIMAFEISW